MIRHAQTILLALGATASVASASVTDHQHDSAGRTIVRMAPTPAAVDTGAPLIVELYKTKGLSSDLKVRLKSETDRAVALGRTPIVEFSTQRCDVCRMLDASLQHPRLREVLHDMYVIRVDVDVWKSQLSTNYSNLSKLPLLVALGMDGRPTGQVWSGAGMAVEGDPSITRPEYDDAYVEQVAVGLKQFFRNCQSDFFRALIS
jgi:hypothetical protein